jgi:hypothetical protein
MTMPSAFAELFFLQGKYWEVKGTHVSIGALIKTFVKYVSVSDVHELKEDSSGRGMKTASA